MLFLTEENRRYLDNFLITVTATVLFVSTYYLLLPALPLYFHSLGANKFEIGIIMGFFSVSSLILRPISGQLVDSHGRKKIMQWSIIIYLVTPLFYLAGVNIFLLVLVQIIYGLAIGSYTTSSTTYVSDIAPRHSMASVVGWFSIAIIIAKGIAPAIGTYLYRNTSFMFIVWFTLLMALSAMFLVSRLREISVFTEEKGARESFFQIISQVLILYPTLTLFCGLITFGVISVMLPLFAHHQGIENIENFFVIHTLTVVATRLFTGLLKEKYLPHLVIGSLLLLMLSLIMMSLVETMNQLLLVAFIYGVGYGAIYPALSTLVVLTTPMTQRGSALGFFTAAFDLGVSVGTLLGGLSEFFGFRAVYLFGALIPFLGLLLFISLYLPQLKKVFKKASA